MTEGRVVYLSGGVGGARLAHGLAHALRPEQLTLVVNTGDDFSHWGLDVSPDLDTVMYTLADLADVQRGWGLAEETFATLGVVERYGGEAWFQLGDRDLGTHIMRSHWRRQGMRLTDITQRLCCGLGVQARVLPMSDAPRETMIDTAGGTLSFQDWLVRGRGQADVERVWFRGEAKATDDVLRALDEADLVVLGPSNPYVSIDPILTLPGVTERVRARRTVGVSPIVHGRAVKGPLARMLQTLGRLEPEAGAVAQHYGGLLSGMVVEHGDEGSVHDMPVCGADTIMQTREQSLALAHSVLQFAATLQGRP